MGCNFETFFLRERVDGAQMNNFETFNALSVVNTSEDDSIEEHLA